jgi:tetratricopeptide (TPR) repeat protein
MHQICNGFMDMPERNAPCPCGSGKKYKKCCLSRDYKARKLDSAPIPEKHFIAELRPDLDAAVDHLLARLESGAGRKVEREIKALLEKHPRYHQTNYLMGVYLAIVMEDPVGALPFFEKAVRILPPFAEAHYNLGEAARMTGDLTKAIMAYRAAVQYSLGDDEIAARARKQLAFMEKVLLKSGSFPSLDAYLANAKLFDDAFVCLANREFEQAIRLFNQVLSVQPDHVQSFGNLGLAYAGLGQRAKALECIDQALAPDPGYEPAMVNRRVIEQIREGEPSVPHATREVHYYADRLNQGR